LKLIEVFIHRDQLLAADVARSSLGSECLRFQLFMYSIHHPFFQGVKRSGFGKDLGVDGLAGYLAKAQICEMVGTEAFKWY
jgi:acyl-CoA reductase-like NAD-dependent aldehyde dehydrogenase